MRQWLRAHYANAFSAAEERLYLSLACAPQARQIAKIHHRRGMIDIQEVANPLCHSRTHTKAARNFSPRVATHGNAAALARDVPQHQPPPSSSIFIFFFAFRPIVLYCSMLKSVAGVYRSGKR
jgi:hypothetical protein